MSQVKGVCLRLLLVLSLALAGSIVFSQTWLAQAETGTGVVAVADDRTVTLLAGGAGSASLAGADALSSALLASDRFRVVPVVGQGDRQNLLDLLYLRGIDVAVVPVTAAASFETDPSMQNIERQIRYIATVPGTHVHILANGAVEDLNALRFRRVGIDPSDRFAVATANILFSGLDVSLVSLDPGMEKAAEMVSSGHIAAYIFTGAPSDPDLNKLLWTHRTVRLLAVPWSEALGGDFLAVRYTADDYPALIAKGEAIAGIAAKAVLATFNWQADSERYGRIAAFVDVYFNAHRRAQAGGAAKGWSHPELFTPVAGWIRFEPAEAWLGANSGSQSGARSQPDAEMKLAFQHFVANHVRASGDLSEGQLDVLFRRFDDWRTGQTEAR